MRHVLAKMPLLALATVLLAACGGGGSGHSSGGSGTTTPPTPTVVRLAGPTATIVADAAVGDAWKMDVAVSVTVSNLGSKGLYLHATDASGNFQTPVSVGASAGANTVRLPLSESATAGDKSGTVQLRACEDSACSKPYDGATASASYTLKIVPVPDWSTHQGNASHNGYVPIRLDASKFAKVWEWNRPADGQAMTAINPVVTGPGRVYLTTAVYFADATAVALDEATGLPEWSVTFPAVPAMNPPAIAGNDLFVSTTGSDLIISPTGRNETFLWKLSASSGVIDYHVPFDSQWSHLLAPTIFDQDVFLNAGYYGGTVYAFDRASGAGLWKFQAGNDTLSTPAVDERYVYQYSGEELVVIDRIGGSVVKRIQDPYAVGPNWSAYHASPVIGLHGNVIGYSGSTTNGQPNSTNEQFDERPLVSYGIAAGSVEWVSSRKYLTPPAVANGVVYTANMTDFTLDALDEATGRVLWSWSPGSSLGDTEFRRNVVVTKTHVFVSTDKAVYAVDLATHSSVWRYPLPGELAISSDRMLIIVVASGRDLTGKLVAIKLH